VKTHAAARRAVFALTALALAGPPRALAADPAPAPPTTQVAGLALGTVMVGRTTYEDVRVRSRDARSVLFTHRGGLASARLRDLPPATQALLGYDPATDPGDPPAPAPRRTPAAPARKPPAEDNSTTPQLEQLFLKYDTVPAPQPLQSLQSEFIRLNLAAKNQGRRPSCAVYAVVSALEFQNVRLTGALERLSEEYLIWATRRSLGLNGPNAVLARDAEGEPTEDVGFTLISVVTALQTYGIPAQVDMPNVPGLAVDEVPAPTPEIIAKARARRLVFITQLPGRESGTLVNSLIHALDSGFPVPAALRWPHERSIRAGSLAEQQPLPDVFHAVTFIGYECPGGRLEDTAFIFKNSYGPRWGRGGYGRATWSYLSRHLMEAYVLDVRSNAAANR